MPESDALLARQLRDVALPLKGAPPDFDPLLERVGDATLVLIGEASHGTHDFYRLRAELTKRLIVEKGFCAIAAEADWPDAWRLNRWVRGQGDDLDAEEALRDFMRFPQWMWRNADVLDFAGWLRELNEERSERKRVGFYGLDLYSLHTSINAVITLLERDDPEAARRARDRYACFEPFPRPEGYGHLVALGLSRSCEDDAVAQLEEMHRRAAALIARAGIPEVDEALFAEQNARVVVNAEQYYRSSFSGGFTGWNLRDLHMADTLDALMVHLELSKRTPKVVVWAHNSHVGDARATEMGEEGELNLGQLARERHPGKTCLIGFSTFRGTVTAANAWGGSAERMHVNEGLSGSYEELFHRVGLPKFLVPLDALRDAGAALSEPRLQRAIGVIYLPRTERWSHYYRARLAKQFDAMIHLDHTRALEPLERTAEWSLGEEPETYPSGL